MPTSSTAKKRVRQADARSSRNRSVKAELKTKIKRVLGAIRAKDRDAARQAFREMESRMDAAARKGIIHPNAAARKKSRLQRKLNAAAGSAPAPPAADEPGT